MDEYERWLEEGEDSDAQYEAWRDAWIAYLDHRNDAVLVWNESWTETFKFAFDNLEGK